MINHAAVLLLNNQQARYNGLPGVIYIPRDFRPLALQGVFEQMYQALFPEGVSPEVELEILHAILPFVHQPDMQLLLDQWDTRKTYQTHELQAVDLIQPPVAIVSKVYGACDVTPTYRWAMTNRDIGLSEAGIKTWTVLYRDATTVTLRDQAGGTQVVQMYGKLPGITTQEIPLVLDRLYAYLNTPSKALTQGFAFQYTINLPPTYAMRETIDRVIALLNNHKNLAHLFEPFNPFNAELTTLRYTYDSAPELTLRFCSALMAYVYQLSRQYVFAGVQVNGTAAG
jgi:hypothetical protein